MDIILDKIIYMNIAAIGLIPAVILVRAAFQKAPKYIRCILWALVAIRLVCPFSIETAFSLVPSIDSIQQQVNENDYVGQDSQIIDDEQVDDSNVEIIEDSEEQLSAELEEHSVDNESFEEIPDNTEYIDNVDISSINIYSIIWLFGMTTILVHSIISYFRLKKRVSTATNYDDRIWVSDEVETPFILGVLRPRIYLPSSMDGEIKKHVLAHEYAHISRRDYIWKPLGFLIVCVHWFNPLVWVAYVLFSRDIEMACDEKVIKNYDVEERKAYSKALLACSASNRVTTECPVAFSEVGVKSRVKSVLNYKKPAFWLISIGLLLCVVLAICFLTNPQEDMQEEETSKQQSENILNIGDSLPQASFDYKHSLPEAEDIISIDIVTGGIPADARLKSITGRDDIEMLRKMLSEIVIIRKAEPEEFLLIGGIGHHIVLRLEDGEVFYCELVHSEAFKWDDVIYIIDCGDLCEFYSQTDLWSQLDYPEVKIGKTGLSRLKDTGGRYIIADEELTLSSAYVPYFGAINYSWENSDGIEKLFYKGEAVNLSAYENMVKGETLIEENELNELIKLIESEGKIDKDKPFPYLNEENNIYPLLCISDSMNSECALLLTAESLYIDGYLYEGEITEEISMFIKDLVYNSITRENLEYVSDKMNMWFGNDKMPVVKQPDTDELMAMQADAVKANNLLTEAIGINFPDEFGGVYINRDKLMVLLTDTSDEVLEKYINIFGEYVDCVQFVKAEYSYNYLHSEAAKIVNELATNNLNVSSWSVSESKNRINLWVRTEDYEAVKEYWSKSGYSLPIEIKEVESVTSQ